MAPTISCSIRSFHTTSRIGKVTVSRRALFVLFAALYSKAYSRFLQMKSLSSRKWLGFPNCVLCIYGVPGDQQKANPLFAGPNAKMLSVTNMCVESVAVKPSPLFQFPLFLPISLAETSFGQLKPHRSKICSGKLHMCKLHSCHRPVMILVGEVHLWPRRSSHRAQLQLGSGNGGNPSNSRFNKICLMGSTEVP